MQKTLRFIALIAPAILLLGAFFKISHWYGANVLITVGSIASILFFIFLIYTLLGKQASGFERINGMLASLVLIIALMAFMFKVLHLAGAAILIWIADVGILLTGVLFMIEGFLEKDPAKWRLKIITTYFILFLVLLIGMVHHNTPG